MASQSRVTHAVTRFLKSFQKQHKADGRAAYPLLAAESLALSTTALPREFFRQVKSLLEKQQKQQEARFSTASSRSSIFSSSSLASAERDSNQKKSRKRGHKESSSNSPTFASSDCYARLAKMLAVESADVETSSSSMRSVAVPVAVETLLELWDSLLQLLQLDDDSENNSSKQSILALVQAIVQRHEFDVILNSLATSACGAHRSSSSDGTTRKRRVSSVRLERAGSFRVVPATSMTTPAPVKKSRRNFLKKSKRNSSSASSSLCLLARKYLELHQATLQFTEDSLMTAAASKNTTASSTGAAAKQMHDLLAALVAASFIRIPFLREKILEKLQRVMVTSKTKKSGLAYLEELHNSHQSPLALFKWHHCILSKCNIAMVPYNRDEFWYPSVHFVETVLEDNDSRMLLCGNLIQQLTTASAWGRVEWKRIPGFAVLVDLMLLSTETLVQSQMRALEMRAPAEDDLMEAASTKSDHSSISLRESFSIEPKGRQSPPSVFFFRQSLKLLGENQFLIHPLLMVIFKSTNYMLPHHVEICLQYLDRLITAFPRYFQDEPLTHTSGAASTTVDISLMHHVFTCLLESEHFEILKSTELFLLKHFSAFSHTLRSSLTSVFAAQFRHLFLHWHRDVRYCFFHVLLYLTYSGNRIVLCARSDESILGAEAAQLFEIPGLVRTSAMAAWEVFDTPLHAMLTRYNRVSKQLKSNNSRASSVQPKTTPSTWADNVPFAVLARSIPEYKRQVQTYFQCAKQFSLHEPAPVPVFYVKGAARSAFRTAGVALCEVDLPV